MVATGALTFSDAMIDCQPTRLPETVSDGFLRIGAKRHLSIIPAGGSFDGEVKLCIVLVSGEELTVRGRRVVIELRGESRLVESYDG